MYHLLCISCSLLPQFFVHLHYSIARTEIINPFLSLCSIDKEYCKLCRTGDNFSWEPHKRSKPGVHPLNHVWDNDNVVIFTVLWMYFFLHDAKCCKFHDSYSVWYIIKRCVENQDSKYLLDIIADLTCEVSTVQLRH